LCFWERGSRFLPRQAWTMILFIPPTLLGW
jgi:hypothetical protein